MRSTRFLALVIAVTSTMLAVGVTPGESAPQAQRGLPTMCCMGGGTHLGGPLYGSSAYSAVRGHADYYSWSGGHREFNAGLWNAGKLAGKTLTVYAGGHKIGTMHVASTGGCHLHHDTDNGQYVPTLSAGDTVSVKTSSGALVASGTLHKMQMM